MHVLVLASVLAAWTALSPLEAFIKLLIGQSLCIFKILGVLLSVSVLQLIYKLRFGLKCIKV